MLRSGEYWWDGICNVLNHGLLLARIPDKIAVLSFIGFHRKSAPVARRTTLGPFPLGRFLHA